jgi:hypothetical protein
MGLSIRAYARHRGVSHVAVKKAIDTGRISQGTDGTIDPARADQEWEQNTASPRKPAATSKAVASASPRPTAREPAPEHPTPVLSTGGTSLLQARTVNEVVKAQTNKVRLARLKGDLVDRSQAIAHVFRLARSERDAWLNWPARISAQMAAKLEVDAHALHVALEAAVREHLIELGELRPRVD